MLNSIPYKGSKQERDSSKKESRDEHPLPKAPLQIAQRFCGEIRATFGQFKRTSFETLNQNSLANFAENHPGASFVDTDALNRHHRTLMNHTPCY